MVLKWQCFEDQSLDFDSCDQTLERNPRNLRSGLIELAFKDLLLAIIAFLFLFLLFFKKKFGEKIIFSSSAWI